MEWNELAQLSKTTTGGQSTSYIYDTDGSRLLRKDPTGSTLYLDGMELQATGSAVTATRYYTSGDATVALRKAGDAAPTWLLADTQGSAQVAIEGWTGTAHRQRYTPYGAHRGGRDDITATEHGFLNHVEDSGTGLDQIGARYYDPNTGRFISPDPIQVLDDPQQRNPYSYARTNPATLTDPTGTNACVNEPGNGGCQWQDQAGNIHSPTGVIPKGSSSSGGNATTGPSNAQLDAAKARLDAAKAQIRNAAMGLLRILSEELGITDGFNCFVHGDMGACVNTAVNVLSSAVGGLIGKVLAKYGAPWRVVKGIRLGKRLWGLADKLITSIKDFIKARREIKGLCLLNSFVAGTRVRLANGKHKPIEKIKPGDKVLATDPKTGKTKAEHVIAAFSGTSYDHLVQITLDTDGKRGHRTGTIVATEHHLFFDQTHHTWTPADHLTSGTKLRTPTGKTLRITQTSRRPGHPAVHDLTIASSHTYYVEAGSTPVLVHNNEGCIPGVGDLPRKVVNSNMGHIDEERAARAGFEDVQSAQATVRELGQSIQTDGFPEGTIPDTAHADRVLVPVGDNGYAVYQIKKNGNAAFKTILTAR